MDYYMLTTTDNPFSPVTQHDEWLTWDMAKYNSYSLLARVAYTSPELSELHQLLEIQAAIDVIVNENVSGVHTKVLAGSIDFPNEESNVNNQNTKSNAA